MVLFQCLFVNFKSICGGDISSSFLMFGLEFQWCVFEFDSLGGVYLIIYFFDYSKGIQ